MFPNKLLGLISAFTFLLASAQPEADPVSRTGDKPGLPYDDKTTPYCNWWIDNAAGEDCEDLLLTWDIPKSDFARWNPSVTPLCGNLLKGRSYCLAVAGEPVPPRTTASSSAETSSTTSSSTTTSKTSSSTTSTVATATTPNNGIRTPEPTQPGLVSNCNKFHLVKRGDNCAEMAASNGISLEDFMTWNPRTGKGCAGLWANAYACVSIIGRDASKQSDQAPSGPSPTQPGIAKDCKAYYRVQSGDTCQSIADSYGTFALDDFAKWNPAVGAECRSLWVSYHVCVGVPGTPSTKPSRPLPVQPGIRKGCDKYHKAVSGDGCQALASKYDIKLDDFYKWNPALKNDCSGLWLGYHYCVAIPKAFRLRSLYHADCTGKQYNDVTIVGGSDGTCINTNCQAASLDVAAIGNCPNGQVQISYWEDPGCSGKWFGYGYTSRGKCHKLWTEGWNFKSLHLRCASEEADCVNQRTCTHDPKPARGVCME